MTVQPDRRTTTPWPAAEFRRVLTLRGDPTQRGWAQGALLGQEIRGACGGVVQRLLQRATGASAAELERTAAAYAAASPERFRQELGALAEAAEVSLGALALLWFVDDCWERHGCTMVSARGGQMRPLLGHNLDFPARVPLDTALVAMVDEPMSIPYLALTWSGVAGTYTGLNARGVALAVNICPQRGAPAVGLPVKLAVALALSTAESARAAVELLSRQQLSMGIVAVATDAEQSFTLEHGGSGGNTAATPEDVVAYGSGFTDAERAEGQDPEVQEYARARVQAARAAAARTGRALSDLVGILAAPGVLMHGGAPHGLATRRMAVLDPVLRRAWVAQGHCPPDPDQGFVVDLERALAAEPGLRLTPCGLRARAAT
jgi:hypothetical protein